MPPSATPASGVDETAIRCRDLAAMIAFYRDIVGLEAIGGNESRIALRAGEGFADPARRVVLFSAEDADDEAQAPGAQRVTLTVTDAEALGRAETWLRAHGLAPSTTEQGWSGWKCLTVGDPEGNTVELAAPVRQRSVPGAAGAQQG